MRAILRIVAGEGEPKVCEVRPEQPLTLGRGRGNQLVLHDEHASRSHAEIRCENGRWFILPYKTVNPTHVNGEPIYEKAALDDGQLIRIGNVAIQFDVEPKRNGVHAPLASSKATLPIDDSLGSNTPLCPDELTSLYQFMTHAVNAVDPRDLVMKGLQIIQPQISAKVVGFLSLDKENPLPKLVFPELEHVDVHLSRRLTQEAEQGQIVWLAAKEAPSSSDDNSLLAFTDAICIPLCAGETRLGALHAYKTGSAFQHRDVQFMEILARHLANSLHLLRVQRTLEAENSRLRVHSPTSEDLKGDSLAMKTLRMRIARLARIPSTVLIMGESGAGKELVALALHRQSQRHEGPLVCVNCAAIAKDLAESLLFGARKGAYTNSYRDSVGFFGQADEGTLFLDEVGELSQECQAKLLRVLEDSRIQPVGAESTTEVDVRIIAATNRDLAGLVATGALRPDLYYRLEGVQIQVPPLREHLEDIPQLALFFLEKLGKEWGRIGMTITDAALRRLQDYCWPGNVRQFRTVLANAIASAEGSVIQASDICLPTPNLVSEPPLKMEELEAWNVKRVLRQKQWNVTRAAKVLGVARETLNAMIKRHQIVKEGRDSE